MTRPYNSVSRRWPAGVLLSAALLTGCAVGPDFVPPGSRLGQAEWAPRTRYADTVQAVTGTLPTRWWALFDDPVLARLEARAQASGIDLEMASVRIEEAQARLGIVNSRLRPQVDASAAYAREALSENGRFVALGAPTRASDLWRFGFNASWEIDLWGRARRADEGAAAIVDATMYDREAARVLLTAEVARGYLMLRESQAQLHLAHRNQEISARLLALTESRERNGVATRFAIATARGEMAVISTMVPQLLERRNSLMNALALLLGEPPRALDAELLEDMPLPSLPKAVPVGLPSDLARRRPDIQSAEARLRAATAALGVAEADFYPRIMLLGRLGAESFELSDLGSWDSRTFSMGPTVFLPVFDGGKLTHRLELVEARHKAAALDYRQTVLRAWHEVDNALEAWSFRQREHAELRIFNAQSEQAFHVAERGYQEGAMDYLSVLVAQRNVLASQGRLNVSATDTALALVDLYKSLGGGWEPTNPADSSLSLDRAPSHSSPRTGGRGRE